MGELTSTKIAMITDILPLYERTMYLNQLEQEARKLGIEIDVFTIKTPRSFSFDNKFPVVRLINGSSLTGKLHKYDILHVQFTLPLGFLFTLLKGLHRKPVIIHTHGYDVFEDVGVRRITVANFFTKLSWKAASHIIAVCHKTKKAIVQEGIPDKKVSVLYNGVDANFFRRKNKKRGDELPLIKEKNGFTLLNVGSLVEVKNQMMLLVAFKRFLDKREPDFNCTLVLCGDGPFRKTLKNLSNQLHINKNVLFLGKVPHSKMPELYSTADAFILPSLSEAHPWSLLEAMSCELPVVASRVGGIPETLSDERFMFNPKSVEEITKALCRIVDVSKENKGLGLRNRKRVLEHFTLQKHLSNLNSIYERLLKGNDCSEED